MATKLDKYDATHADHTHGKIGAHNAISTETIAIFTVTTSILWTQSYMLGVVSADGQTQNTGNTVLWLYTPTTSKVRGGDNVDLGRQALLETANMTYGGALFIFVTILFLRAITNVVIPHPYNREGLVAASNVG